MCTNMNEFLDLSAFKEKSDGLLCTGPLTKAVSNKISPAIEECNRDPTCNAIWDVGCEGQVYYKCGGVLINNDVSVGCIYVMN